jgi:hypothetical protein
MGSLLLFVVGVAAPLAVALTMIWAEQSRKERRLKGAHRAEARRMQPTTRSSVLTGAAAAAAIGGSAEPAPAATAQRSPALPGLSERDAAILKQAFDEWGAEGLISALDQLKGRLEAVAEMEMIWADPHSHLAQDQNDMLHRALWVFEPEYVVSEGRFDVDARYGAVAKPMVGASLVPGHHIKEGEPVLVVELKNARATVGADQQQKAWANVRDLIRGGVLKERDQVDVFVVGGNVDELDGNPRLEGRYRNVRITSYDYDQFITRAKRLTFGLYDALKDQAPFLRRHREEIAAAQNAAAEQAAAEASAPAPEPVAPVEQIEPVEEPDLVRHEDFADAPRRGEYEDEPSARPQPVAPVAARVPAPVGRQRAAQ